MNRPVLTEASCVEDYAAGRALIEEYAAALGVDLCFQNFSDEIANLSGIYGPPRGCLLLARVQENAVGCVGVRSLNDSVCEMKRLYVQPQYRGTGVGRRLAEAAIGFARRRGFTRMVLDTLPDMTEALYLYASLGFREVEGYYPNPVAGVRYLALELAGGSRHPE